ncbi:CBS domain-containing protein [Streptomyces vastus]|uniref:CBS domain-containing protein n=1 Tax=Streptomyces vastus TaxID=285451 RepID=UPI003CD0AA90
MTNTETDALPVLDEEGRVAGVLTAVDIVAALADHPAQKQHAGTRPQAPPTVLPGPPPRRDYRGTAVPRPPTTHALTEVTLTSGPHCGHRHSRPRSPLRRCGSRRR